MSETASIVSPLLKALRALPYCHALRLHSGSARGGRQRLCPPGTPDALVIVRGAPVFFEAKLPGEKPTDAQLEQAALLRAAGAIVHTIHSVHDGLKVVRELLGTGGDRRAAR